MGWGTYYKFDGYLSRIGKHELHSKREQSEALIAMYWNEILGYMAMTPPVYAKSEEGTEYPWVEFLDMKFRELKEGMEEEYRLIQRIDDCLEAMEENPDNVTEG